MKKEETVDYHIKSAWHAISRMYNKEGSDFGITASTGFVLLNIDSENGTPATKIAPLLGMEARSLTRMLKSLEENELIYRQQDSNDKRLVRIYLTDYGKEKRSIARGAVISFNDQIKEKLNPEQLQSFFAVMDIISKTVEEIKLSQIE